MGYNISTRVSGKDAYNRMLAFLKKEFRHYAELSGGSADDERYISDVGGNREHSLGTNEIGFHYNSGWGAGLDGTGFERLYYQAVLNWVALTVGEVSSHGFKEGKYPYTIYEGNSFTPLVPEKPLKRPELVQYWVDVQGIPASQMMLADRLLTLLHHLPENPDLSQVLKNPKGGPPTRKTYRTVLRNLYWGKVQERMAPIRAEIQRLSEAYAALP
jgi:hypothetical protein